ncbi:MAG: leucyl-tRNA synthetase [Candidatus Nomurabacteria bacterium]|nr:leucyl-tRNA synthetase [Candidatus Nomurabacteria bacterium]
MKSYDHEKIDKELEKKWQESGIYKTKEFPESKKVYILDMFPYPSGEGLHVGHPKGYIATDIYSRFKRMNGFDVLHPMGWDAFGLPAEQFALKNKVHPRAAVEKNIANFKSQLANIGLDYDWSREINTTDPEFYKWTQWIFTKMYEKGLAYESNEPINWCPTCKTGLANEDVENGECERCHTPVEKKPIRQWVLKITDYADRLIKDLDELNWPEGIKLAQKNWIGKSEGAEFTFNLTGISGQHHGEHNVKIFTTRSDTIFGVTYVAISPLLANSWLNMGWKANADVKSFIDELLEERKITEKDYSIIPEKKGIFTNIYAQNPANGEKVPVWIANYVLGGVGTGAIMAVPAHDERDFEFAKKYNLPIKEVIRPYVIDTVNSPRDDKKTVTRTNVHAIVYDPKNKKYLILRNQKHGWDTVVIGGIEEGEDLIEAAKREIKEETGYIDIEFKRKLGDPVQAGYFAAHKDENRISISTGLYFELIGDTQVPIAEDEGNEILWIDEKDFVPGKMINSELPFWLERLKFKQDFAYTGTGIVVNSNQYDGMESGDAKEKIVNDLGGVKVKKYKLEDWVFARQRYWGEPFPVVRDEEDKVYMVDDSELPVILPEVESYEPTGNGESPLADIKEWVEVKGFITEEGKFKSSPEGKIFKRETNTMPQWAGSSWYYLRFADPHNTNTLIDKSIEKAWLPVDVYVGGDHATRHLIYARFWHKFLYDIGVVSTIEPFSRLEFLGFILAEDGRKMSKRWGNVINPDDVVKEYGADTLRVYEMFMAPFDQTASWSTTSIKGSDKFLDRVFALKGKIAGESEVQSMLHKTIKKVGEDIESFKFNTAVSQMMILVNEMEKASFTKEDYISLLKILAPFAPHITEYIWGEMGESASVHKSNWPKYDEKFLMEEIVTITLQIGGKMRGTYEIPRDSDEKTALEGAQKHEIYQKYVGDKIPEKVIYVQNRLINIVI